MLRRRGAGHTSFAGAGIASVWPPGEIRMAPSTDDWLRVCNVPQRLHAQMPVWPLPVSQHIGASECDKRRIDDAHTHTVLCANHLLYGLGPNRNIQTKPKKHVVLLFLCGNVLRQAARQHLPHAHRPLLTLASCSRAAQTHEFSRSSVRKKQKKGIFKIKNRFISFWIMFGTEYGVCT